MQLILNTSSSDRQKIALLSVADKSDIVKFASHLQKLGYLILSTGGTAKLLQKQGIDVQLISEYTSSEEILSGRVKTLHPKIFAGILAKSEDAQQMQALDYSFIDIICVNLYQFEQTIANTEHSLEQAIEQIDIGGVSLLRAAAKNFQRTTVICNPDQYEQVAQTLSDAESVSLVHRAELALQAFEHTSTYDHAIASYLQKQNTTEQPATDQPATDQLATTGDKLVHLKKGMQLRYGENSYQTASLYFDKKDKATSWQSLQGKQLSFNNILDTSHALLTLYQLGKSNTAVEKTCVIVKHCNPCGVATSASLQSSYELAFATDATSAFGGIIAMSDVVDEKLAATIVEKQFVEVLAAPDFSDAAMQVLATKKNLRVVKFSSLHLQPELRSLPFGGFLYQDPQIPYSHADNLQVVTKKQIAPEVINDLLFTANVCSVVKSNAIVFATNKQTLGIGAGQMSRVQSVKIAVDKAKDAGLELKGSVVASDAFFPFADSVELLAEAGASYIIQPGGSIRDSEVIAKCDELGIGMLFTDKRSFRH